MREGKDKVAESEGGQAGQSLSTYAVVHQGLPRVFQLLDEPGWSQWTRGGFVTLHYQPRSILSSWAKKKLLAQHLKSIDEETCQKLCDVSGNRQDVHRQTGLFAFSPVGPMSTSHSVCSSCLDFKKPSL